MAKGSNDFTIRHMRENEVEETYGLIDKEMWNLTLDKFFYLQKLKPQCFYVAVDREGIIAGTISLFPTFPNEYIVGNIVVKECYRGQGVGRTIIEDMVARHPGSVISLTAVPGADQFYVSIGFQFSIPQQGQDIYHLKLDVDELYAKVCGVDAGVSITCYEDHDFDSLLAYDLASRGYDNKAFISMMVLCSTVVVAKDQLGHLRGYVAAFKKRGEIVLDGLFADSDDIALLLFVDVVKKFPGMTKLKLQIPTSRQFLTDLGKIVSSYKYNRYSLGMPTPAPLGKVYNFSDCDYTY